MRVPDDVPVTSLDLEHHSGLFHSLDVRERISHFSGTLEVERFSSDLHPVANPLSDLLRFSIEKEKYFFDHGAVIFRALGKNAGRLASLDEVVETGALGHFARHVV